jgi:hypothetical protein
MVRNTSVGSRLALSGSIRCVSGVGPAGQRGFVENLDRKSGHNAPGSRQKCRRPANPDIAAFRSCDSSRSWLRGSATAASDNDTDRPAIGSAGKIATCGAWRLHDRNDWMLTVVNRAPRQRWRASRRDHPRSESTGVPNVAILAPPQGPPAPGRQTLRSWRRNRGPNQHWDAERCDLGTAKTRGRLVRFCRSRTVRRSFGPARHGPRLSSRGSALFGIPARSQHVERGGCMIGTTGCSRSSIELPDNAGVPIVAIISAQRALECRTLRSWRRCRARQHRGARRCDLGWAERVTPR